MEVLVSPLGQTDQTSGSMIGLYVVYHEIVHRLQEKNLKNLHLVTSEM